jgi:hypothetical protein
VGGETYPTHQPRLTYGLITPTSRMVIISIACHLYKLSVLLISGILSPAQPINPRILPFPTRSCLRLSSVAVLNYCDSWGVNRGVFFCSQDQYSRRCSFHSFLIGLLKKPFEAVYIRPLNPAGVRHAFFSELRMRLKM